MEQDVNLQQKPASTKKKDEYNKCSLKLFLENLQQKQAKFLVKTNLPYVKYSHGKRQEQSLTSPNETQDSRE